MRFTAPAGFPGGVPKRFPRALATARAALGRSEMTSHDPPTHARFGAMAGPRKLNSCCSIGTIGAQLNACQHRPNMTSQAEESKHVTPEMCAVLRYTAEHGCMAKIGEPWLGPARLLERQGLIVLWRCLAGHYAARLTPAGAEVLTHGGRVRKVQQAGVTSERYELGGWEWGEPLSLCRKPAYAR